jgi:tripartite-type tricarboxylate transporter receptor subunit TctC
MAGIEMVRVPYRGAGLAIPAILSGEIQFLISSIGPLLPLVDAGQIRALAVTSPRRSGLAPSIPTAEESGLPEYSTTTWYGLFVPTGTPRAIIDRINEAVHKVLAEPDVKSRLMAQGFDVTPSTPEEFGETVRAEIEKWKDVVKDAGLTADSPQ